MTLRRVMKLCLKWHDRKAKAEAKKDPEELEKCKKRLAWLDEEFKKIVGLKS